MWHHSAQHVTVMVLRSGTEHPIAVVLKLRAIFQPERDIPLPIVPQANIFRRIEEIGMQRRPSKKAPVLLSGKRVQRWPTGVAHIARWLRIGSLSKQMADAQQHRHGDHYHPHTSSGRWPQYV